MSFLTIQVFTSESASVLVQTFLYRLGHKHVSRTYSELGRQGLKALPERVTRGMHAVVHLCPPHA